MCTALSARACFKAHGKIKTEQTYTQRLQTFHRARPHKLPAVKAHNLEIPGWVEVCNFADDYDPRSAEYRNDLRYKPWFQNISLSYQRICKTPIFQTILPAYIKVALGI